MGPVIEWETLASTMRRMAEVKALITAVLLVCWSTGTVTAVAHRDSKPSTSAYSTSYNQAPSPSLLIVTALFPEPCRVSVGNYFNMLSIKNKEDYAATHNYKFLWFTEETDSQYFGPWNKAVLLRNVLRSYDSSEYEWILWVDVDTLIVQMNMTLDFSKYTGKDLIMWGALVNGTLEAKSYNAGVMLLRNTKWLLRVFEELCEYGHGWGLYGETAQAKEVMTGLGLATPHLHEQATLAYLMHKHPDWLDKVQMVGVESGFHNMYRWNLPFEQLGRWAYPFITHYASCQFCSYASDDDAILKEYEKFGYCTLHFLTIHAYVRKLAGRYLAEASPVFNVPFNVSNVYGKLAEQDSRLQKYKETEDFEKFKDVWRDITKVEEESAIAPKAQRKRKRVRKRVYRQRTNQKMKME